LWLPGGLVAHGILDSNHAFVSLGTIGKWLGGVGPSVVAFLLVAKDEGRRGMRELLGRAFRVRIGFWYIPTFLIVPAGVIIAHLLNASIGGTFPTTALLSKPWLIPVVFLIFLVMQAGEEFGWRGYALPRLQRRWSALVASLLVGVLWAAWHIPMFLIAGFGQYENHLPFGQFAITLISMSVLIAWLQNNSRGSLVPAFVCHAFVNLSGEVLPLHAAGEGARGAATAWTLANLGLIGCVVVVLMIYGARTMTRGPDPIPGRR
jgi:hypothetical protein